MKKSISVLLTIFIILVLIFTSLVIFAITMDWNILGNTEDEPSTNPPSEQVADEGNSNDTLNMDAEQIEKRITEIDSILENEFLILVNPENGLERDDEPAEFASIEGYRLDKTAAAALTEMLSDMRAAGHGSMTIYSAFRNYAKQESNFNNKINQYINRGYDEAAAKELAATIVNPPGKSEHQTGLAVDICTSEMVNQYGNLPEQFAETDAYVWLSNHCAEYGFILRYPKNKAEVTGISFEPWHYRYVGKEIASEIMSRQICLEEYISELKAEKDELMRQQSNV